MISDGDLYRLAIFLGSCAMMMIILYHFLDVNACDEEDHAAPENAKSVKNTAESTSIASTESAGGSSASLGKHK
ncbi:uncharacterized protein N7459_004627 [Penicillium hispanicum]|uniref:uncharacterized protein n=1 Tax=Penicillium hispanicum TaxID=1080232 RepID=UPI00254109BA|nr:uncharacterized protein N7459_004627 [Penicillium hispanicum]KAJ5584827.1 hypothetical protein N7459_004627 [Penicillium hispanicum]